MGIRYYAYPVRAADVDAARADPCAFHGDDPLMDAWGPEEERPDMLYLDKCWHELQVLFEGRAALPLVEGSVTFVSNGGWRPFERVLDPGEVTAIADDLALVTDADIRRMISENERFRHDDDEAEYEYVAHYLRDAVRFTRELSDRALGLVYVIG